MSVVSTQQQSGSSTSSSPFLDMDEMQDEPILTAKSTTASLTVNKVEMKDSTSPQKHSQRELNMTNNSSGLGASLSPNSPEYSQSNHNNIGGNNSGNSSSSSSSSSSSFSAPNSGPSTPSPIVLEATNVNNSVSSSSSSSKINVNAPVFTSKTANRQSSIEMDMHSNELMKKNISYDCLNDVNNNNVNNINNNQSGLSPSMTLNELKNHSKNEQQQQQTSSMYLPSAYASLPLSLNQQSNNINNNGQCSDYDSLSEFIGVDKLVLQQLAANAGISVETAAAIIAQKKAMVDPQQQMLAQAIAALSVSNQGSSCNTNVPNIENNNNNSQQRNSSRSLMENIELLNSKYMNQKQHSNHQNESNQNQMNNYSNNNNNNNNNNINDFLLNNTPMSLNLKRQASASGFPSLGQAALFSTPIPTASSPATGLNTSNHASAFTNNRLNSTPNLQYGSCANTNEQSRQYRSSTNHNMLANQSMNSSNDKINSMSTSNSSFNLNSSASNGLDLSASNQDDDDVFSSYQNQNISSHSNATPTSANNSANSSSINQNLLLNSLNNTSNPLDALALAKLYHSLMSNPNLNSSNLSDFLNNTPNLSALSLNTDILNTNNSQNFLNLSNSSNSNASALNQLKNLSTFNGNNNNNNNMNNNNNSQSNNNSNNSNNNFSNSNSNPNQFNLSQATLAALKQRQNTGLNNTRIGSSGSSNIAALTSQTSNIASLLNGGNQMQQQQFMMNDPNLKRRVNSIATTYNLSGSSNSNSNQSQLSSNQSSIFSSNSSHHVGPNATHLLQNSSLASSARLNTSTSSSAAASVLGNNSSLSHAFNSLQQQQQSQHHHQSQSNHPLLSNSNNSGLNFNLNSSPNSSSNHGLLSALSLSTSSNASQLASQLLSGSVKPLRSERLPPHVVEEIIKQAKIRRRMGGKKEVCVFCRNNGEKEQIYTSHTLKDASNHVACPILRLYQCPICHASGDQAHTIKYCPYAEKDSTCIKLFKENGRMSAAAAAFLMNSLAGGSQTPPSLSPPGTPSPSQSQHHLSGFMNQSVSPTISSPNGSSAATAYSITQALNNFNNLNSNYNSFAANATNNSNKSNDLGLSLNKSFGGSSK